MHTTGQLATAFGKSEITITRWVEAFSDFLSPSAIPGPGKTRMFTDEDVEVLALVAEQRNKKRTESEIYELLKQGERGIPPTGREITVITTHQMTQALAKMEGQLKALEQDIQYERKRADRAEGKVELLTEMLKEKEAEIDRLKRNHG